MTFYDFCAAKVVVELAKPDYLQAAVVCHPSFVTVDDIRGMALYVPSLPVCLVNYLLLDVLLSFQFCNVPVLYF